MECLETSAANYQSTMRHILEERISQQLRKIVPYLNH
jgi:hypothetical protein